MKKTKKNYLEFIPERMSQIQFNIEENELVTLEVENKGVVNRVFQLVLKKPKTSYIHLDELGCFIWWQIDGKTSVLEFAEKVKVAFDDKAEPLYERLVKFMEVLKSYKFINLKEK